VLGSTLHVVSATEELRLIRGGLKLASSGGFSALVGVLRRRRCVENLSDFFYRRAMA
jgi:hypothetical protein